MLHKTRGIVFHTTEYSETSVVVKMYTELFGFQSYHREQCPKKKCQDSLLRLPITQLWLKWSFTTKNVSGLQRISEIRPSPTLRTVPFDVLKSSMALFLNEVLYKSIREEEANAQLFDFLFHSIQWLDVHEPANSDFHLLFLLQLSKYLGFFPTDNYSRNTALSLISRKEHFKPTLRRIHSSLSPVCSNYFHQIAPSPS